MSRGEIAPGFVEDAIECLRRRNIDPAPVLRAAGLPDPVTGSVSTAEYGLLWLEITNVLQDEFFGLMDRPMRPGSFKLLCHTVLHARTLERALRRALQFLAIVFGTPNGELVQRNGQAEIVLRDRGLARSAFAYRTYWLILLGVHCWLIGRRIPLLQVDFACPAPENRRDYHQFFGAPVHFDAPCNRLVFSATYLSLPTVRDEPALSGFLRNAPANILLGYRHDQSVTSLIHRRLGASEPGLCPSFETLAAEMKMSPATLRRRLRSEGQSFIAIRDELRFSHARAILSKSDCSISEVALALGYAEPSAFHRAFLKWSGTTPAAFRNTILAKSETSLEEHSQIARTG